MGTRNINGQGTTYYDEKQELWVHEISCLNNDNNRIERKRFKGKTKTAAVNKGLEYKERITAGLRADADKVTLKTWVDEWLMHFVKPSVRPRTYEKYESDMKCYILPYFGDWPLEKLTTLVLQKHFNMLSEKGGKQAQGLSSSTVRGVRRYLTTCLDEAIEHGLLLKNPVKRTNPPRLEKREFIILEQYQIERMIEEAAHVENEYMMKVLPVVLSIAVYSGMRLGEIFGLQWGEVSFRDNYIYVTHSMSYIVGKGPTLQLPKTKQSKRKILMPEREMKMLQEYKAWQDGYKDLQKELYKDNRLVFPGSNGNFMDTSNFTSRYFKEVVRRADIDDKFHFHGLRHTHASMLLKNGVNPKVIQERLGHSNIGMTLDIYSHIMPDMQKEAVDAINKLTT